MKRREFFSKFGLGAIIAVVVPSLLVSGKKPKKYWTRAGWTGYISSDITPLSGRGRGWTSYPLCKAHTDILRKHREQFFSVAGINKTSLGRKLIRTVTNDLQL